MLARPRLGLVALIFTLEGSILPKVALKVVGVTLFAVAVVAVERRWPAPFPESAGIGPFTLIGLALSIFLSFRNGACYDRWWEARRAWGALLVSARTLARLLGALLPDEPAVRARALRRVAGFAHALHASLRCTDASAAVAPWLPASEVARLGQRPSAADAALAGLSADLGEALRRGLISDVSFATIEREIGALAGVQATCERIHTTPLPFAYTLLLYRTAWLYCLLLPFGLAASLGYATPVAAALVAYTFFGLDALGDELEEPFGLDANDLPLDALRDAVEAAIRDALADA